MDIAKLLPLLLATQNNKADGNSSNLNQILPELLKAQSGDNNALTGMLLNMLSSNFNKQNSGLNNTQTEQMSAQNTELKAQSVPNNAGEKNDFVSLKNYKNFYSPPESKVPTVSAASTTQNAQPCNAGVQCVNNVYPSDITPKETTEINKKNSAENNNATNIKTPFGYTRLY